MHHPGHYAAAVTAGAGLCIFLVQHLVALAEAEKTWSTGDANSCTSAPVAESFHMLPTLQHTNYACYLPREDLRHPAVRPQTRHRVRRYLPSKSPTRGSSIRISHLPFGVE